MIKKDTSHWIDQTEIINYLQDVRKYSTLTREEEYVLIEKIKTGCNKSKDLLINSNLRYVISMAKQYQNQGLSLPDLINEGNYGLVKAAERYDYNQKETRFLSYAVWWIKQSIMQSLHENSRMIRLPVNKINNLTEAKKMVAAEHLENCNPYDLLMLPQVSAHLDQPLDEDGNSYHDIVEDHMAERPDVKFVDDKFLLIERLKQILINLNKSERYVITKYFGLDGDPVTLEDISEELDLTKERVRQIKEKAIKKLRYHSAGLFELL